MSTATNALKRYVERIKTPYGQRVVSMPNGLLITLIVIDAIVIADNSRKVALTARELRRRQRR